MAQARFWNFMAKRYARTPVADQASYERKLEMTKALLKPNDHVLEVGCGTGTTALWHAPHVASVEATDFSDRMIAIAQDKADGVPNATFRVSGVDDAPLRDRYDAILAMSILHLLPDPAASLQQLAARLSPGGYVFSSTVCVGDMGGLVSKLLPLIGWTGLLPRVKSLTKSDVTKLHQDAGLTIIEEFQPKPGDAVFVIAQAPGADDAT